jgi:hypothetical protein
MKREGLRKRLRGLFRGRPRGESEAGDPGDPGGEALREEAERLVSPDGRQRLIFYRRRDGLWEFVLENFHIDDIPEYNHHLEYWHPLGSAGLYDSLATARREASAAYPWAIPGEDS